MGTANDLKPNAGNPDGDARVSIAGLKERANEIGEHAREGAARFAADPREAGRTLKDRAMEGLESGRESMEAAQEEVLGFVGKVRWRAVLGAAAGLAVVAAVILAARRRARRHDLLQRGMREGTRVAMLIPAGWHMVRNEARHKAERAAARVAEESERLWNKLPRIRVE